MSDTPETNAPAKKFDFSAYPADTLFYDRRSGLDRRDSEAPPLAGVPVHPRAKVNRRRRIDPTTFDKQYTEREMEFMTAMQRFKVQSGKAFPSHGEVLAVARSLGYYRPAPLPGDDLEPAAADHDPDQTLEFRATGFAGA